MRGRRALLVAMLCALTAPIAARVTAASAGATRARTAASALQIWPLGDSITLGISWPTWVPGGYRGPLDEILNGDNVAHEFVGTSVLNSSPSLDADGQARHDGHGGYRIDQVLTDLDGVAHADSDGGGHWLTGTRLHEPLAPDVVLVHLGTNDIMQDWDTRRFSTRTGRADFADTKQRTQFVADMTARLRTLLMRIHTLRSSSRIIVATIIPIAIPQFTAVVGQYAASVRQLVSQLDARRLRVQLADAYAAFTMSAAPGAPVAPGLLSYDDIHPTPAGYTLMARTFAAALETA